MTESSKIYGGRLKELILGGALVKPGIDDLFKTIKKEFPDETKDLTKKSFSAQVDEIVWDKKVDNALMAIVGNDLPLKKFLKHFGHIITEDMAEHRAKKHSGLTKVIHPVTFLRGLGRIGNLDGLDEGFQFPDSSFSNPFEISIDTPTKHIRVINGANMGLRHRRIIKNNTVLCAFDDAERRGVDAVILTNLLYIDTRKSSGGFRVLRSMVSGLNTNEKLLSPNYRERLKEERVKNGNSSTPVLVYETVAERFMNVLYGCRKVSRRTHIKGAPARYNGPVYIILGYNDEEMIANAVNQEIGYWTKIKQDEIEAEIKAVKVATGKAKNEEDWKKVGHLEEELQNLSELKSRTIISNVSAEDIQYYVRKVTNFVVQELEKAIPNSKVIGQSHTFVKMGNEVVEFHIPHHLRVGDSLLANYNKGYGARATMQIVPETAIICHPYALGYRTTAREIAVGDKRAEARAYVAPIAVDGGFLRDALKDAVRDAHPISKAIFNTQFSPGVLDVKFYPGGNVSADPVPIGALTRARPKKKSDTTKYIWTMVATDPHFGSRMREEVWSDKAKGSLGMSDAVIQMFRDAGLCQNGKLPIHLYTVNDDPTQGNHFGTHNQPHPRQISYKELERLLQDMPAEKAVKVALQQFRLRGSDWLNEQVEQVKERHIRPNLDFFSAILARVVKSGLTIRGISQIHSVLFDRRDLGAINWGTGNHFEATVDRTLTEGGIYADYLRALLYGSSQRRITTELIDRLVLAPMEGNQYFAWGTVKAPNGYEWAIEFRGDPPRMGGWADPLLGAVRNDALRGDYGLFMTGRKALKVYGDKHFFAGVKTEHVYYTMGAPGTSTDLYGHRGFPPNNTGVTFVGLPADGPDSGPIMLRTLHVEHIRRYFEEPYEMDWDSFLPNPV